MSADGQPDRLAALKAEHGYSEVEESGVDALIDYKNAVEDRLVEVLDLLDYVAAEVPTQDEWRSAADFMETTATRLDHLGIERPEHYAE